METLVFAHRKNQHRYKYNGRYRGYGRKKFQTFDSGEGLLPTPSKSRLTKTPVAEKTLLSSSFSPKTPSAKGRKIEIPIPVKFNIKNTKGRFSFSELWAGPAYSNSPPPSSLPIPKFSMKPKRTVSLDLPTLASEFDMHPVAKSAPATPTRERSLSPCGPFDLFDYVTEMSISPCDSFDTSDSDTDNSLSRCDQLDVSVSATVALRRILNLDD